MIRLGTITRRVGLTAALALIVPLCAGADEAQNYPTHPITVIVPFGAGSASTVVSRILLARMGKSMGQKFIVETRPGAGGNIGTALGAKAAPDGYTLTTSGSGPMAANKSLYRHLDYDPDKDFEDISPFAVFPIVIVASKKLPVKTLQELIAYAKKHPGLNFGSVGIGSSQHLAGAYFEQIAGVKMTHVPYKNIGQYGPDLIAGIVPLGFQWLPNVAAPLGAGGARALAVASKQRLSALPNVPTTAEAGLPSYIASGWFALMAPHGTPKPIVDKLNKALAEAVADPDVRKKFAAQGAQAMALSPEASTKFMQSEAVKWAGIIKKAGVPQIQ